MEDDDNGSDDDGSKKRGMIIGLALAVLACCAVGMLIGANVGKGKKAQVAPSDIIIASENVKVSKAKVVPEDVP